MILVIDLIPTHGGGQQVLVDFVRIARRAGQRVVAVVAADGWLARAMLDVSPTVAVRVPKRTRSSTVWRTIRALRFCLILLRRRTLFREASLIVVNDPEAFIPAVLIARLFGKHAVLYLHMAYTGLAARVIRFVAGSRAVRNLVCVSRFVVAHTEHFVPAATRRKIVLIESAFPAGTEAAAGDAATVDVRRVAVVGRLVPDKGQDVVCELSRRLPDTQFYLIGSFENADPAYVEKLRKSATGNVHLVGYQSPVVRYLQEQRIGIVLVPSRIAEALSLAPIEATLAGCAVVARNFGGLAEVAANVGLATVDSDGEFEREIRRLQATPPDVLRAQIDAARHRVLAHYHPDRFEHDVRKTFGW